MSMFSITSWSSTPRRAAVCSNGYRFTQTRSIGSMPCSFSVATCAGLSRTARTPAAIFGLIVLTRPSSISGKPVRSSIGRVSMPASARCLAVPPVETISTPSSRRQRAKSAMPVLSDTVMSARLTRTSPGAVTCTSETVSTSVIDNHPTRIRGIDRDFPPGYETYSSWQQLVLDLVDPLLHNGDVPRIGKLESLLKEDGPAVDSLVDEMHGNSGNLHAVVDRLSDRADARECREQRRVHVHDPVREAPDEHRGEQLHEPREHDQLRAAGLDPVAQGRVALRPIPVLLLREHRCLDACGLSTLEPARVRAIRPHADDLDVTAVEPVDQRLEVAPLARDEDDDREAHAAMAADCGTTFNFGNFPPVVARRPASIRASTRARMSARRMCDAIAYAPRPSYEFSLTFLLCPPWRISTQAVRPTVGRALRTTEKIASSSDARTSGGGGGATGRKVGAQTSQQFSTCGCDGSPKWRRIAVRRHESLSA